jgi:hypothetical protein
MKTLKLLVLAALVAGCNDGGFAISAGGAFVVLTGGEQFRVRIESAFMATTARRMMSGQEAQKVITGTVVRGDGGTNTGYGWHLNPLTIQYTDTTDPSCNALPSVVQANIDAWEGKKYCPWPARFLSEVGR